MKDRSLCLVSERRSVPQKLVHDLVPFSRTPWQRILPTQRNDRNSRAMYRRSCPQANHTSRWTCATNYPTTSAGIMLFLTSSVVFATWLHTAQEIDLFEHSADNQRTMEGSDDVAIGSVWPCSMNAAEIVRSDPPHLSQLKTFVLRLQFPSQNNKGYMHTALFC